MNKKIKDIKDSKQLSEVLSNLSREEGKIEENINELEESLSHIKDNFDYEFKKVSKQVTGYEKKMKTRMEDGNAKLLIKEKQIKNEVLEISEKSTNTTQKQDIGIVVIGIFFVAIIGYVFRDILFVDKYMIPFFILLAVGFVLLFVLIRYAIYLSQYKDNILKATKEEKNKQDILKISDVENSIYIDENTERIERQLKRYRGVLNYFKNYVKESIPQLKNAIIVADKEYKYNYIKERYLAAIKYYSLDFREINEFLNDTPLSDEPTKWEDFFIEKTCELYKKYYHEEINPQAIQLLYADYKKDNATLNHIWRNKDDKTFKSVSSILFNSKLLPHDLEYDQKDLIYILASQDSFDLNGLKNTIHDIAVIYDLLTSYHNFLLDYKLEITASIHITDILSITKDWEKNTLETLFHIGKLWIASIEHDQDKSNGLAVFTLPLFYANNHMYRSKACKKLESIDNEYALNLVFVYNELSTQYGLDGKSPPSIKDVIDNFDNIFQQKHGQELETNREIQTLRASLANGEWLHSSTQLILKRIDELKEQLSEVQNNKKIIREIKNLLKDVKEDTITRVLESQLFSAYLITFRTDSGSIRDVIEALQSKYGYTNYTNSSRLGILPQHKSFKEFKDEFEIDLKSLLKNHGNYVNPNVIIQKLTPSEHTFKELKLEDLDNVSQDPDKKTRPMELIRDLVQEKDEGLIITTYDRKVNLLEILNKLSIPDLISESPQLSLSVKERKLLDDEGLWIQIEKNVQCKRTEIPALSKDKQWGPRIKNIIADSIYDYTSIPAPKCAVITSELLKILDTLARIREA